MGEEITPRFGGVPFRALADGDLTVLDLRLLAAIAAHDGFNKNRRGCFASHKRLAALIGAHYKSAARSLARLIERGYLDAAQQGEDGRLRVYRVIYNEADHAAFRGDGRTHAPAKALRSVTSRVTDRPAKSVTHRVTDLPPRGDGRDDEIGNPSDAGSVTENDQVGNRNAPPNEPKALKVNAEGSLIYSTKQNINIIDQAEAGLENGLRVAGAPPGPRGMAFAVVHRPVRYRQPRVIGPATDEEALIDRAIERRRSGADPIDLDEARRPRPDVRPTQALLDSFHSRKARGLT